jgi:hypothetical protein
MNLLKTMEIKETKYQDKNWIPLAQDIIQWWAAVNMAMNLQVPLKARHHQIAGHIFSLDGFCSLRLHS